MAWIRTISYQESTGKLRQEYDKAIRRAGRVFNIVRIMGLKPTQLQRSIDFYITLMHGPSNLSRAQREMLAVLVSKTNHCHY